MSDKNLLKPLKIEPNYERMLRIAALGAFVFGFFAFPVTVMLFVPLNESFSGVIGSFGPLFGMMLLIMMVRLFAGSWNKALEVLEIKELSLGMGLAIPLIAFVTIIVSGSITMQWQKFAQEELHWVFDTPDTVEMTLKGSILQMVILTFSALVAAPVFEEILFRRVLYNFCSERLGTVVSMITASFIFAAMHMTLLQLPGLFAMAMVWQYIYLKERNLTITILLHFCNNLAAMGMLLLARFLNLAIE